MLLCGLYEIDITPPLGLSIPGQLHDKKSTGILDNLYAKSLVIDNGVIVAAILSLDICAITHTQVSEIRKRIHQLSGIEEKNILVAATHTHTGGPCELWPRLYKPDTDYLNLIIAKGADCVVMAYQNRKIARIGFGKGSEQRISFHRRYRMKNGTVRTNPGVGNSDIVEPDGPIDSDVTVMRIDDTGGSPMGVITNFACHLDCVGGTQLSGDYPGELSGSIKHELGNSVVSLFLTGGCGNINHINFLAQSPIKRHHWKRMGALLAEDVLQIRSQIVTADEIVLETQTDNIQMLRRMPSESERTFMQKTLALPKDDLSETDWWSAMQIFLISAEKTWDAPVEIELQVMRFGELAVVAIPFELFVEYSLAIKQHSWFPYNIVSTLTNGLFGYVPTPSALAAGGYEATLAYTSCLQADAGEKTVDSVCNLLDQLYCFNPVSQGP